MRGERERGKRLLLEETKYEMKTVVAAAVELSLSLAASNEKRKFRVSARNLG